MLGNLQCKSGQEAGLPFTKAENTFSLAEEGHLASGDNPIRVDDIFTGGTLGVLEFGRGSAARTTSTPSPRPAMGLQ
jgi:hypothetical protein